MSTNLIHFTMSVFMPRVKVDKGQGRVFFVTVIQTLLLQLMLVTSDGTMSIFDL